MATVVEAIRKIPGPKHLVMEEGLQSAWFCETLSPHAGALVDSGVTQSRGYKRDKRDAWESPFKGSNIPFIGQI